MHCNIIDTFIKYELHAHFAVVFFTAFIFSHAKKKTFFHDDLLKLLTNFILI